VLISASLAASGYIVWQHLTLVHECQRSAEFAAAARQGVVTLMSIDPDHAMENIQRIIDETTSPLKNQLEASATYMVKNAQDAKVTTKATVKDVAVESMTDNSAVVLVVAHSDTTNPDKSKRPPVFWRLSVDINRDDGQLKISKVDFVQ
jgi:Mce-associated membrane protein